MLAPFSCPTTCRVRYCQVNQRQNRNTSPYVRKASSAQRSTGPILVGFIITDLLPGAVCAH